MNNIITLKRYPNRKLYGDLGQGAGYYTLPEIIEKVKQGYEIRVFDHKTKQDITLILLKRGLKYLDLKVDQIKSIIRASEVLP